MVIFHKYFLFVKTFNQDFTKYLTCFCCIFISLKISNIILTLEDLLKIFLKIYYKENFRKININNELISAITKKVFQIEFDILNIIGFDLNIDLPYDYIFLMNDYFIWNFQPEIMQQIKVIIISFINDSFKLPLCLYYHPLLIFLACLNLLSKYFNFELKEKDEIKWFNLIEKNISFEEINDISDKIKVIYYYSNDNKDISNKNISSNMENKNNMSNMNTNKNISISMNSIFKKEENDKNKDRNNQIILNKKNENIKFSLDFNISKSYNSNISNIKINEIQINQEVEKGKENGKEIYLNLNPDLGEESEKKLNKSKKEHRNNNNNDNNNNNNDNNNNILSNIN